MIHYLKTWPEHFNDISKGHKKFELRRADRPFSTGDTLCLQEYKPAEAGNAAGYTGREVDVQVLHILHGASLPPDFGLQPGFVIMSIVLLGRRYVRPEEPKVVVKVSSPRAKYGSGGGFAAGNKGTASLLHPTTTDAQQAYREELLPKDKRAKKEEYYGPDTRSQY